MTAIGRIQWLISFAVLGYGIALISGLGVTAILFVGIGVVFCGLAAWASTMRPVPLAVAFFVNCLLAYASIRLLFLSVESVIVNAKYRQADISVLNYFTIELVMSSVLIVLFALYAVSVFVNVRRYIAGVRS